MGFQRATKKQAKARIGLIGPSGSGKTYTALRLATNMGMRVALIDTERGSAAKYADKFVFDTMELIDYNPQNYINGIKEAEAAGYDVLIIDSLSHAWSGTGGILDIVDTATAKSRSGNAFTTGWREATPIHNKLIDSILGANMHIIATMRSKTEYVIEDDGKGGKKPRKVGMAPVQRDGMEYEFDIVADMDQEHNLIISKTRCDLLDGKVFHKPGEDLAAIIMQWLSDGEEVDPLTFEVRRLRQELGLTDDAHPLWKQVIEKSGGNLAKVKATLEFLLSKRGA